MFHWIEIFPNTCPVIIQVKNYTGKTTRCRVNNVIDKLPIYYEYVCWWWVSTLFWLIWLCFPNVMKPLLHDFDLNALPALQMFNVSVRMTMQWSEALISAIYRDGKRRHLLDLCSFKDLYKLIHIVYTCINVGNGLKMLTYTRFLWI